MIDWSELANWSEYTKLLIGLAALVDPLSAAAVFLGIAVNYSGSERGQIALVASLSLAVTLIVFTFLGELILNVFGIQLSAFQVAGGILLLLMALEMMRESGESDIHSLQGPPTKIAIGIVPLAIPLLAGPAAMSTVVIYTHLHEGVAHKILMTAVILTIAVITLAIFRVAPRLLPYLGQTGLTVLNRIIGLIVAAVAIEFILDGIARRYPSVFLSG
ncbi:MAG: NAAT family transporter [Chloroflexi bacterium]|nr:NAAT family transporter [Chloroflexota bacterium]